MNTYIREPKIDVLSSRSTYYTSAQSMLKVKRNMKAESLRNRRMLKQEWSPGSLTNL